MKQTGTRSAESDQSSLSVPSWSDWAGSQNPIIRAFTWGYHEEMVDYDTVACECVDKQTFKRIINIVIFANAIQLGMCSQGQNELRVLCFYLEMAFTVIFALEAFVKIRAQRWTYFRYVWNDIDFLLVVLGIFDHVFHLVNQTHGQTSGIGKATITCKWCAEMSLLRMIRLSRTLRLFRILRSNRRLMILAEGLVASLRAMIWVATLLFVLVYAGGIFAFGAFKDEHENVGWTQPYFGSLFDSMLTLFDMSILDHWRDVVKPVASVYPQSLIFFVGFIFIAHFGILNLIIGIIIDSTTKTALEFERKLETAEKDTRIKEIIKATETLFEVADRDEDALITMEELAHADSTALADLLEKVTLPPSFTLVDLYTLCSPHSSITKHEFIDAMRRMVFSDEFERDCRFQYGVNDLRRRVKNVEGMLHEMRKTNNRIEISLKKLSRHIARNLDDGIGAEYPSTVKQDGIELETSPISHESSKLLVQVHHETTPTQINDVESICKQLHATCGRPNSGTTLAQTNDTERINKEHRAKSHQLKAKIGSLGQEWQSELQALRYDLEQCLKEARVNPIGKGELLIEMAEDHFKADFKNMWQELHPDAQRPTREEATAHGGIRAEMHEEQSSPPSSFNMFVDTQDDTSESTSNELQWI